MAVFILKGGLFKMNIHFKYVIVICCILSISYFVYLFKNQKKLLSICFLVLSIVFFLITIILLFMEYKCVYGI